MTDTEKLEPGWYWVKVEADDEWEVGERTGTRWWFCGSSTPYSEIALVGPRLTPPGEG